MWIYNIDVSENNLDGNSRPRFLDVIELEKTFSDFTEHTPRGPIVVIIWLKNIQVFFPIPLSCMVSEVGSVHIRPSYVHIWSQCACMRAHRRSCMIFLSILKHVQVISSYSTHMRKNAQIADRQTDRQTDRPTDRPTDRHTDRPTDRQTDLPTDRQTDWPTNRPTDRPTNRVA